MKTYDDLQRDRKVIAKLLSSATDGEISDFDFIIDYVSSSRPIITILLGVPAKVKREYDFDMDNFLDTHMETIRQVLSFAGYPNLFSRTVSYQIL